MARALDPVTETILEADRDPSPYVLAKTTLWPACLLVTEIQLRPPRVLGPYDDRREVLQPEPAGVSPMQAAGDV
jgi:hypothetical protein